ncbi:MAG: redoxin domain-containing protein [Halobacteria archaeon]
MLKRILTGKGKENGSSQTIGNTLTGDFRDMEDVMYEDVQVPLARGDPAPEFSLEGTDGEVVKGYDVTWGERPAIISFYLFDFHPPCRDQICMLDNLDWFGVDDVDVYAIGKDSVFSHREFSERHGFRTPLLSDPSSKVADLYGVRADDMNDRSEIPIRSVFLVGTDGELKYSWIAEEPGETPDISEFNNRLDGLIDPKHRG